MTPIEYALIAVAITASWLGYHFGYLNGVKDANQGEQRRRDRLAREIEEGVAALHSRPQLHSVADVTPLYRRGYRDGGDAA